FATFAPFGFFIDTEVDQWTFAPRAKLKFDALGRSHDLIVGIDLDSWKYGTRSASSPSTPNFSVRTGEQENAAFYAQTNFWMAERTRAVLGYRTQRVDE